MNISIVLFLSLVFQGVGLDTDDVKSVSAMEGENLTLHTDDVKQKDDPVMWLYKNISDAKSQEKDNNIIISSDERRKIDPQTRSLTIINSTIEDSGLYRLKISRNKNNKYKNFNVTIYAHLPVPDIRRYSQCSSSSDSKCLLLCSVVNVSHVSLSWYKGSSLLSSISVSDLHSSSSLPLEVDYEDTDTYTCVLEHRNRNQSQHVNITEACQPCSNSPAWKFTKVSLVMCGICVLLIFIILRDIYQIYIYIRDNKARFMMSRGHTKVHQTDEDEKNMFKDAEAQMVSTESRKARENTSKDLQ